MMRGALALVAVCYSSCAAAQLSPALGMDDPRLQTVIPAPGIPLHLTAFPDAPLTLLVQSGDSIRTAHVIGNAPFDAVVVGHQDALSIRARAPQARGTINLTTAHSVYTIEVETGTGLRAAYVVRMVDRPPQPAFSASGPVISAPTTSHYRFAGSHDLEPSDIRDDGRKTYIRWRADQALPAVLAIGPTGGEEIVNGYMRGDVFTIDRVYSELVFRIDKTKAEARREAQATVR